MYLRTVFLLLSVSACTNEIAGSTSALDGCPEGYRPIGRECDIIPPRLVAPISGSRTGSLVEFRWELARGTTGARIEICDDPACSRVVLRQDADGSSVRVTVPTGRHYWRAYGKIRSGIAFVPTGGWKVDVAPGFPFFSPPSVDLNSDWYGDLAVAAHGADRVHVFLGSSSGVSTTPSVTLTPPAGAAEFGQKIASAGDLNGDGFGDLVVGASASLAGSSSATPRVYAYLGSATGVGSTPIASVSGDLVSAFGFSLVGVGDTNQDGYADIVVGSPGYGFVKQGRVYLFRGGPGGLTGSAAQTWSGSGDVNDNFGAAVGVADVNNDNRGDLIVGEVNANYNFMGGAPGRVHVYLGTTTGFAATPWATLSCPDGDFLGFGRAVSTAGDWNWDGFDDIIVGAYGVADYDGRAYVFAGGATGMAATPIATLAPPTAGEGGFFGYELDGGDDVDFDYHADLAIGESDALALRGRISVFYGPIPPAGPRPRTVITSPWTSAGYFGEGVAIVGDLNGDFRDDLFGGAPGLTGEVGGAAIYHGAFHADLPSTPVVTLLGLDGPTALFGACAAD